MRLLILLVTILLITSIVPHQIFAQATTSATSAVLAGELSPKTQDIRVMALENTFKKYNSPLIPLAAAYVNAADKYGVDWKLLPAISGLESSFGIHLMPNSYNAYGWGGGYIYFKSWEEGIDTINKALRVNYMDKWGASDVWEIGPIYAESPTWAVRVNSFMNQIQAEYVAVESQNSLKPNL